MFQRLTHVTALLLDGALLLCAVVILFVALTGGGTYHVPGGAVRVTSVHNPVLAALVLLALRCVAWRWRPRIGLGSPITFEGAVSRVAQRAGKFTTWARATSPRRLAIACGTVMLASVTLRALNVALHPGFVTGDDVEIHEMTLGYLFGRDWPVWNLRSPLYPMLFIFPAQYSAHAIGMTEVSSLVSVGRFVVVIVATASLWLAYAIGRRLGGRSAALLSLVLMASSRLHLWYGSSELPRPVATVFILAAFLLLLRRSGGHAAAAGAALGIGGALRFGEAVFFVPAFLQLAMERRWRDATILCSAGVAAATAALALADWLYWGSPFFSLQNAYDYTIVQRQSSRGFQPAWYYLSAATSWTNWALLALSLGSLKWSDRRPFLWGWSAIAILSLLPHKEARYLIAAHPFVCISAALAAGSLFERAAARTRMAAAAAVAVLAAVVIEAGDWRAGRTDRAVMAAREIAATAPHAIAAQHLWRLGGQLYFADVPVVTELPDDLPGDGLGSEGFDWILLRHGERSAELAESLVRGGYATVPRPQLEYIVLRRAP